MQWEIGCALALFARWQKLPANSCSRPEYVHEVTGAVPATTSGMIVPHGKRSAVDVIR
jgi:hypothetical protein